MIFLYSDTPFSIIHFIIFVIRLLQAHNHNCYTF